jgi:hypothetical protein
MRWIGILAACATLTSAVAAYKPGSPAARVAKHHEKLEREAQAQEAARQARANGVPIRARQDGSKFLNDKTARTFCPCKNEGASSRYYNLDTDG